jgi:hypothetical protein
VIAMTARQEILEYINDMPDKELEALRPLFRLIKSNEPIVIETDLTDEEKRIIADGMQEYKAHPERAVPLDSLL